MHPRVLVEEGGFLFWVTINNCQLLCMSCTCTHNIIDWQHLYDTFKNLIRFNMHADVETQTKLVPVLFWTLLLFSISIYVCVWLDGSNMHMQLQYYDQFLLKTCTLLPKLIIRHKV